MSNAQFTTPDVQCNKCAARVREALGRVAGVNRVDVEPDQHLVRVEFDEQRTTAAAIAAALADAGYPPG
jgi:copper chaperone CopZ